MAETIAKSKLMEAELDIEVWKQKCGDRCHKLARRNAISAKTSLIGSCRVASCHQPLAFDGKKRSVVLLLGFVGAMGQGQSRAKDKCAYKDEGKQEQERIRQNPGV